MRRLFRGALGLLSAGVLLLSSYRLLGDLGQKRESGRLYGAVRAEAVRAAELSPAPAETEPSQTEPVPTETAPIAVDFALLEQTNGETVGWLYCPDTPIDLPVVQGEDNARYLHRLFDGTPNNSGTLFVDFRNAGDFSDEITVIYGHNLKNGAMFGTLTRYKEQAYYEAHPTLWLLTPGRNYRVDLTAGCVVPYDDGLYAVPHTAKDARTLASSAMANSTFSSGSPTSEGERFLLLSTCSYEYENARYVLIGRMTEVG